jgi:hypothetical protein
VQNPSLSQYGKDPAKIVAEPPPCAQPQPASGGGAQKTPTESFDPITDLEIKNPGFRLGGGGNTVMQEVLTGIALATGESADAIKTGGGGDPGGVPGGACSGDGCISGTTVQSAYAAVALLGGWLSKGLKAVSAAVRKLSEAVERRVASSTVKAETRAIQRYWPPNRGFLDPPVPATLSPGTRIDRFGHEGGTFVSPEGTPFTLRGLPPESGKKPYNIYEVVKPLDVQSGTAAPAFGGGLGPQYELPASIDVLVKSGHLRRVQ